MNSCMKRSEAVKLDKSKLFEGSGAAPILRTKSRCGARATLCGDRRRRRQTTVDFLRLPRPSVQIGVVDVKILNPLLILRGSRDWRGRFAKTCMGVFCFARFARDPLPGLEWSIARNANTTLRFRVGMRTTMRSILSQVRGGNCIPKNLLQCCGRGLRGENVLRELAHRNLLEKLAERTCSVNLCQAGTRANNLLRGTCTGENLPLLLVLSGH